MHRSFLTAFSFSSSTNSSSDASYLCLIFLSEFQPQFIEPDMYVLNFNGGIVRDSGLYSLSAANVAGVAASSVRHENTDKLLRLVTFTLCNAVYGPYTA